MLDLPLIRRYLSLWPGAGPAAQATVRAGPWIGPVVLLMLLIPLLELSPRRDGGPIREIALIRRKFPAQGGDGVFNRTARFEAGADANDVGARFRETFRHGEADAALAAGNEGGFSAEVEGVHIIRKIFQPRMNTDEKRDEEFGGLRI